MEGFPHAKVSMMEEARYDLCPAWYCARTKPKHEHLAARAVGQELALEVFHPRLRIERLTRRGVVRTIEPLFPCYIFVRCPSEDRLDEVRYVTGISSLVRFGLNVATVPDPVIAELKLCFEAEEPMPVEDRICPGAEVTIVAGVFRGFSGVVVRALPAKRRVQILLDFLGRASLAEVDRGSVIVEDQRMADMLPSLVVGSERQAVAR